MKKLLALALLLSAALVQLSAADAPKEPKAETISSFRLTPKEGHDAALKAAIAAHAQKYHTGSWKWRVYDVLSGPDGGSYHIVEGPMSWTTMETRGDLGAEHMKDYETNVLPHILKASPDQYSVYQSQVSTVAATQWSTKSAITHYYVKPARGPALMAVFKQLKPVWEKLGANIVVWSASSSGSPQFAVVRRFKNGWKDFDEDGPTIRATFDEIHGDGSYDRMLDALNAATEKIVGEFIEYKPELSSK